MTKVKFKGSTMLNPVPAVLITSKNIKGNINVFTAAWVGTICTHPAMVSVSIRPERLSYEYIKEKGEFVINMPSSKMIKKVDFCGVCSGRQTDKIKKCNFELVKCNCIDVPMISECPICLECKLEKILPLGSHDLFLARILAADVEDTLIDNKGKIHAEKANLICYSHGEYFCLPHNSSGKFGYSICKKNK